MAEKQTLQLAMGVQRARQLLSFAALLHARLAPIDSTGGELLPSGLVRLVCEVPRWSAATSEITVTAETSGVRCPHCEGPGRAVSLPRADCVLCDDCCWECRVAHAGMHTHCRGCKSVFCDGFQACAGCDESLLYGDAGASAISTQNCVTLIPFRSDETVSSCSDCNGLCPDCRPVQHDDYGCRRYEGESPYSGTGMSDWSRNGCSGCDRCLGCKSCDRCPDAREGVCALCDEQHDQHCMFPY